jgi:short subunit dehydrogenase-like uncharacterized protein
MKELDIVVFGATGFTGRLVAQYLAAYGDGTRWAVAGRNRAKLDATLTEIGADVPILIADAGDQESLRAIAAKTAVVCTTVGPYSRYGTPLVAACVEAGIGYCDLTGEPHWIREMIQRFHGRAVETGARIVHCCGFDSIPSDLGVLMLADHVEKKHRRRLAKVRTRMLRSRGGVSGGTLASAMEVLSAAHDPEIRRALLDPYTLDPEGSRRGPDEPEQLLPRRDEDRGRWVAPFPMSWVNARVVRRSNALMGYRYGESFEYDEAIDAGAGPAGFSRALGIAAGMAGFTAAAWLPATRDLLKRFLPHPGEGPTPEERERGSFVFRLFAESDGSPPLRMEGTVAGRGDPGYAATSRMLGESALCLAHDRVPARGVLTPAVAMGPALLERLRRADMTFEVADA